MLKNIFSVSYVDEPVYLEISFGQAFEVFQGQIMTSPLVALIFICYQNSSIIHEPLYLEIRLCKALEVFLGQIMTGPWVTQIFVCFQFWYLKLCSPLDCQQAFGWPPPFPIFCIVPFLLDGKYPSYPKFCTPTKFFCLVELLFYSVGLLFQKISYTYQTFLFG